MEGMAELGYQIVMSEEIVERIIDYKNDLINGKTTAGKYFEEKISGLDLNNLSNYEFTELLLSTKKPKIYAARHVKCDDSDWSSREFSILGDINVAVKAIAYDNGVWKGNLSAKYDTPLNVELLFSPGIMLNTRLMGDENNPDYKAVVENGKINQNKYNALVERRLFPLLSYANNETEKERKAFVVLPGIGCGCFAGKFKGQMENNLDEALQAIIKKQNFPNIKCIHLGLYQVQLNLKKEINGVLYEVRGNGLPQLSHPQDYGKEFEDCKFYKVVAWDHVSLPGNEFFHHNSRSTDDSVSAAATNSMEVITGVKGMYTRNKYIPPKGYKDWEAMVMSNGVKLLVKKENVKIVARDGRYCGGLM